MISLRLDLLNMARFRFPSFHLASIHPTLLQFTCIPFTSHSFTLIHFEPLYFSSFSFMISICLHLLNIAQFVSFIPFGFSSPHFICIPFTSHSFTLTYFESLYFSSFSSISRSSLLLIFLSLRPNTPMTLAYFASNLSPFISAFYSFTYDPNSLSPQVAFAHFTLLHFASVYHIFYVHCLFKLFSPNLTNFFLFTLMIVTDRQFVIFIFTLIHVALTACFVSLRIRLVFPPNTILCCESLLPIWPFFAFSSFPQLTCLPSYCFPQPELVTLCTS